MLTSSPQCETPAHPQIYLVGHAWPPGPYSRPQQPSMYTRAYLGTHTHLTHGQTVSGHLWQLTTCSSYSLTCILSQTPVPVIIQPCYFFRSPYICPGTYMTQSLDPVVQHAWHLEDHITWAKPLLSELRCSLPCPSIWHLPEKTHSWCSVALTESFGTFPKKCHHQ